MPTHELTNAERFSVYPLQPYKVGDIIQLIPATGINGDVKVTSVFLLKPSNKLFYVGKRLSDGESGFFYHDDIKGLSNDIANVANEPVENTSESVENLMRRAHSRPNKHNNDPQENNSDPQNGGRRKRNRRRTFKKSATRKRR